MDVKLQLVKAITLIYRESQTKTEENRTADSGSASLVREILEGIDIPDTVTEQSSSVLIGLRDTLYDMLETANDRPMTKDDLIQRIRVNVGDATDLYEALLLGVDRDLDKKETEQLCMALRHELRTSLSRNTVKDILKAAYTNVAFREQNIDWRVFVTDLINQLDANNGTSNPMQCDAMVGSIDLDDTIAVKQLLLDGKDSICGEGIMRLGWQGFNDMLDGGIRRGESIVVGALRHNFKSGFLLNLARQVAMYNAPYMIDPDKTPTIVFITLENELKSNIIQMYKDIWEQTKKTKCEIKDIDDDGVIEAAEFIREHMAVNGYNFRMIRLNPSDFTYQDLFDQLRYMENSGMEIHALFIDYLLMMSTRGCAGSNGADLSRDLYRRVRNFCAPRQIAMVTAAQLSPDATMLMRDGATNFVSQVAGKSYYAGCKSIDHEVDVEINIHLERPGDNHTYLTAHRGKHRKPTITPEKALYQVYRFEEIGTIPDDILTTSMARKSVGGATATEGGGGAWYDV